MHETSDPLSRLALMLLHRVGAPALNNVDLDEAERCALEIERTLHGIRSASLPDIMWEKESSE